MATSTCSFSSTADDEDEMKRAATLVEEVNRTALEFGGTVTGEHGVGSGKTKYMV